MHIINLFPGSYACACYLVCKAGDAVLIDCSASPSVIGQALQQHHCTLRAILCTHGHFDHILSADAVRKSFGVPLLLHEADAEMPADGSKNAFSFFFGQGRTWTPPERTFRNGEMLTFGNLALRVRHTPGHSKGSCTFLTEGIAFTGDTLFAAGIGRTDLYGGNAALLRRSLQELSALPRDLTIYPGHGTSATLGEALDLFF